MLYTKHNFEIAEFCGDSDARPELQAILVASDKTVATDSYTLVEVSAPAVNNEEKDFPSVPGFVAKEATQPFLFRTEGALQVMKSIPKNTRLPILERAAVIETPEGTVGFVTTNLETVRPVVVPTVEGTFPDYSHLFPEGEAQSVVTFNAEFLRRLMVFFSKFTGHGHTVTMKIYGPDKPLVFEGKNDVQVARAMLMPCRT